MNEVPHASLPMATRTCAWSWARREWHRHGNVTASDRFINKKQNGEDVNQALLFPLSRSTGLLRIDNRELRCVLGEAGINVHKQEGDSATPCGVLPLRRVLYRADRMKPPACNALPREPIAPDDGWCDDPDDANYNRPVRLPYSGRHEALWRQDGLYDIIAVLGYNDSPVRRGFGSAIFLHVARADERPTKGCIAMSLPDLLWALDAGLTSIEVPSQN